MKKELESLKEKRPCIKQWAQTFERPSPSLSPAHCRTIMDELKELQEVGAAIRRDLPSGIAGGSSLSLTLTWLKKQSEEALTHLVAFQEARMSPDEKELLILNLHEIALTIEQITSMVKFKQPPTGRPVEHSAHEPLLPKELATLSEKLPCVQQWIGTFEFSSRALSLDQYQNAQRVLEDLQTVFIALKPALEKHPGCATVLREAIHHNTDALKHLASYQAVCESTKRENLNQRRLLTISLFELVLAIRKILKGEQTPLKIPVAIARKRPRTHLSVVPNTEE
jgi:hypothetical protein